MCTNINAQAAIAGSGKAGGQWMQLDTAHIAYDHPLHSDYEHALMIDFVNGGAGFGSRIALELSLEAAERLAAVIGEAVRQARAYEDGR
ncbi:MAG: hypothetical protein IT303_01895 [Dehalococcoidia bacterium]|nr:hypothetical protein [Dehalococcoidia bacterium]